jgi:trimeric autotransporter adhesin
LDNYDTNGTLSNPGEVIADIVGTIRLHNSCVGRGFFWTLNRNCGQWLCPATGVAAGYNCSGYGDCCTECTGIRESDYAKHASGNPHTPLNYICTFCSGGSGPCGKEVHCENAPVAEAAWDIATRDLEVAPFNYDRNTSFQFAERIVYVGSGSITNWYTCNCSNATSGGCGAANGYMQFITGDDDDGNLSNGTPHMTAIYNAFNRHGVACGTPVPHNSGCASCPQTAPVLTVTAVSNGAQLSWTPASGAVNYYVFKSIGVMGCDFGKIKIATVATTGYTDQALDCNQSSYIIQAAGSDGFSAESKSRFWNAIWARL